ncbi:MAG: haloacid dehalogenase type II [Chloroflexi bacterium]|nr:haloacid dehalogenase type II [Chloroflexota bacterium]
MPQVLVFDVNETLLDLHALDSEFERVFGDKRVLEMWFRQFIENALLSIISDVYEPFGVIGGGALEQVAARLKIPMHTDDKTRILSGIKTLPPHPEVPSALERLRDAGFRLCTLTNSTQAVADAQLTNAGLAPLFERVLSADAVKRLKPAPAPYVYAAHEMNAPIGDTRLIAAHAWDVTGAQRAGAAAAFVARPGMALDPLAPQPDIVGNDLAEVAERIIAQG